MSSNQEIIIDDNVTRRIVSELSKKTSVLKNGNAFRNPKDNYVYVTSEKVPTFWKENRVAHAGALGQFITDITKNGSLSDDPIYDQVNIYEPAFQAEAEDYYKWIKSAAGGIQVPENFSAIVVTNLLTQLRNTNERDFVLDQIGTEIAVDQLTGDIPIEEGFDAQVGITRGAEIPTSMVTYTKVPYTLKLIGLHIAKDNELNMGNLAFDPYKKSIARVARAFKRAKATINRDILFAASVTETGAAWDTVTSGDNANNPYTADIRPVFSTINANDGSAKQIAMNDSVYAAYETNTWIKGTGKASNNATVSDNPGSAKIVTLTGVNLKAYVDDIITTDDAVVIDPVAFNRFQGPDGVMTYDDVHHRMQGYYAIEYYNSKIIETDKVIKITNVLA